MAAPVLPQLLRDGDSLTRDEFLRRWEAMPDLKHAELIDGVVHMPSPVGNPHGTPHARLTGWLAYYEAHTAGCQIASETTWLMGEKDVPQPDVSLRIAPESGGQSRTEGDYAAGAPELIVEVTVSSRSRDLGKKLHLYERMGVREYITALVKPRQFQWRELVAGKYRMVEPDSDGIYRSGCFPGLWLDPAAFWRDDQARVFAVLQQGIGAPEHDAFVRRLA